MGFLSRINYYYEPSQHGINVRCYFHDSLAILPDSYDNLRIGSDKVFTRGEKSIGEVLNNINDELPSYDLFHKELFKYDFLLGSIWVGNDNSTLYINSDLFLFSNMKTNWPDSSRVEVLALCKNAEFSTRHSRVLGINPEDFIMLGVEENYRRSCKNFDEYVRNVPEGILIKPTSINK